MFVRDTEVGACLHDRLLQLDDVGRVLGIWQVIGEGAVGFAVELDDLAPEPAQRGQLQGELHHSGKATVHNVPSRCVRTEVSVDVPGHGRVTGDVAWGGNWFFLVREQRDDLQLANVEALTELTWAIRRALGKAGITGSQGEARVKITMNGKWLPYKEF